MYCLISSVGDRISGLGSIGVLRVDGGAAKVMDGRFTCGGSFRTQCKLKQHAYARSQAMFQVCMLGLEVLSTPAAGTGGDKLTYPSLATAQSLSMLSTLLHDVYLDVPCS